MKKMARHNILSITIIAAVCLLLIFISGVEGCGGTTASKTGLDFSVTEGIDYISSGKTLNQGDSFYVGVKIENYDKQARTGYVCIRDNIADGFGGIRDEECRPFSVRQAETTGDKKSEIAPGTAEVSFPESGEYSYYGMPEMVAPYSAELKVSLKYAESNLASGTVSVPSTQQPAISQELSPITVSVTKSIHKLQDSYKVALDISLRKQQDAKIFSPDFSRENTTYFDAELEPNALDCRTQDGAQAKGLLELQNERLIKCSSIVNPVGDESYPLTITLDYGVSIEKKFPFSIKTKLE